MSYQDSRYDDGTNPVSNIEHSHVNVNEKIFYFCWFLRIFDEKQYCLCHFVMKNRSVCSSQDWKCAEWFYLYYIVQLIQHHTITQYHAVYSNTVQFEMIWRENKEEEKFKTDGKKYLQKINPFKFDQIFPFILLFQIVQSNILKILPLFFLFVFLKP